MRVTVIAATLLATFLLEVVTATYDVSERVSRDIFPRIKTDIVDIKKRLDKIETYVNAQSVNLLDEECKMHDDCEVENSRCNNGKCECQYGYSYQQKTNTCTKLRNLLDSTCTRNYECSFTPGAICNNNKCSCAAGYAYEVETNKCSQLCDNWGQRFSSAFVNHGVYGHNARGVYSASSTDCYKRCAAETQFLCKQVEYLDGVCYMADKAWFELKPSEYDFTPGWVSHYRQCGDGNDPNQKGCHTVSDCPANHFQCQNGQCVCELGYVYDITSNTCLSSCKEYGDTYTGHIDKGVGGCNIVSTKTTNQQQCLDMCTSATDFDCRNVEFHMTDRKCYLCDKTWFDLPSSARYLNDVGWSVYLRNCK